MTSLREDTSFLDSRPVHVRPGCTCLPPRRHPPLPQRFGNVHPAHGVGAVEIGDGAADTQDPVPIPGSWFANTAARRWIWEAAIGLPVNVIRTFRTTFDLTGLDETTASRASWFRRSAAQPFLGPACWRFSASGLQISASPGGGALPKVPSRR